METHATQDKTTTTTPTKVQMKLDELRKLRDELKVKIHLGGMDARDSFKKIEPAIDKAEHEVTHLAKDAAHGVANAVSMTLESLAVSLRKISAQMPK